MNHKPEENQTIRMTGLGGRRKRMTAVFVFLFLALIFAAMLSTMLGDVRIFPSTVLEILAKGGGTEMERTIVTQIRLPRVILAAVLGGALAVSGFLLQTFFGNPIAGPFVLGISSGAKMTVALALVVFAKNLRSLNSFTLIAAAFLGTLFCTGLIVFFSQWIHRMSALLVSGIMVGYICSAVTDFVIAFAQDSDVVNLRGWSLGSFSGADWRKIVWAAAAVGIGLFFSIMLSKAIGAFQMGEGYARSVGVEVSRFRVELILVSSLLSACVTAFAGPISFVGIAVPFLIRKMLGTSSPLPVIPACFLGGAVVCVICDFIARTAFSPTELSISTVTAVFGAPVVIAMMLGRAARSKKE